MLDRLRMDLRQTWRSLAARRGWTLGTAAVLTIGLSLASTIFAVADPFLSRPLPYRDPDRLAILRLRTGPGTALTGDGAPTFEEWRSRTDLFADVAAYDEYDRLRLLTPDGALLVTLRRVSPNFLDVLGAFPGPTVDWRPAPPGAPQPLVIAAPRGPGRQAITRLLDTTVRDERGGSVQVVAALPESFLFPIPRVTSRPDVIMPAAFGEVVRRSAGSTTTLTGIARLRTGVSATMVEAALGGRLAVHGLRLTVEPLSAHMAAGLRPLALGALAAGLLIAIVCAANVMNLVIARGVYRVREFATREALGASRVDLLRLVIFELTALVAAATIAGLFVARAALVAVAQAIPDQYAALGTPALGLRVGLFTTFLGVAIVAACLLPAWISARAVPVAAISRAQATEGTGMRWLRFLLGAGQTAVAMILVVGAALLARSYANLWAQDTGYAREAVVVTVSHGAGLAGPAFLDRVDAATQALRGIPGVTGAAAGVATGSLVDMYSSVGGARVQAGEIKQLVMPADVAPSYFTVVGTRLVAGRAFDTSDRGDPVVIVNEAFATRFWPDAPRRTVVGQTLVVNDVPNQVVGVVQNAHDRSLDQPPVPRFFRPLEPRTIPFARVNYAIRIGQGPVPDAAIRRVVASIDPGAVVEAVDSMDGRLAEGVRDRTFATLVLALFAVAGLGVTATGVFAIVAFVVARRTREIAIRVAIGARAHHILRLVMRDAVIASVSGAVAGLAAARALARFLESYLYGVQSGDVLIPSVAALGMFVVTGFAAWWPTRRALRLEPTLALRVE